MGAVCIVWYRADTQVGPYNRIRNDDNTVKMVRHDYEFIGFDGRKFLVQFKPPMSNHSSGIVQLRSAVRHVAEQTGPVLCADGHKIRGWLDLIEPFQTDRPPVVMRGIVLRHVYRMPV